VSLRGGAFVQQELAKLAMTAIEYSPMQKGTCFNLDGVKAEIEEAKDGARRLRLLGRRVFSLEQDWLREAVRHLERADGGDEARVHIGARC
jgi:hypothetical protein